MAFFTATQTHTHTQNNSNQAEWVQFGIYRDQPAGKNKTIQARVMGKNGQHVVLLKPDGFMNMQMREPRTDDS